VEVTVAGRDPGSKPGLRLHRVIALDVREIRRRHGIPVTAPARTLLDLAGEASMRELERAVAEAQARHLAQPRDLLALLARYPGRRGTAALRELAESDGAFAITRSEGEERLLALIRRSQLPPPEVNVRLCGFEVDFLWRDQRLVVEVDGFAFHSSRAAFEKDRLRDAELQARGFRVLRVTWRQIVDRKEATLARIAQALAV